MSKIKVSDYVIKRLEELNVKHMFMLPGGGAMHLNDSLGKSKKIKFVSCLHEQACSIAAEAYARVTNNVSLLMVTTGPGGTNAITGIAGAYIESTPMIVISGQVKTRDMINNQGIRQQGMQEVDIVSIVKPITKYATVVLNPNDIAYHLDKAIFEATNGRKAPVWIDIPLDVQASIVDTDKLKRFKPSLDELVQNGYKTVSEMKKIDNLVDVIIDYINKSKRPVLLCGNGIRLANAQKEFGELIKVLGIPILTSWNGLDLIAEDNPFYFGRPGGLGHRYANFIQQNSDLFLSIGCRLNLLQTGFCYEGFAREAKKILVDIDKNELHKINVCGDITVDIDAKLFIELLLKKKQKIIRHKRTDWFSYCKNVKEAFPLINYQEIKKEKQANPYLIVDIVSKYMSKDDIYVSGSSGSCIDISMQTVKVKKGQRIFTTKGLASMGYGLPSTIGASFASRCTRNVWSVQGDGGFMMNIQDLHTIKKNNLSVKIFIFYNKGYGAIKQTQKNIFNGHYVDCDEKSGLSFPDLYQVVKSFGLKVFNIYKNEDIERVVKKVSTIKEPLIVLCHTDINITAKPKQMNYKNDKGQMESLPLEYMAPVIDEKLFDEFMLIEKWHTNN